MDIGRCFKDAWNLLMKDLAPLAVTAVVGAVAVGVVAIVVSLIVGTSLSVSPTGSVEQVGWASLVFAGLVTAVVAAIVGAWQYSTLLKIMLRRVREGREATMDDLRLGFEGIGAFLVALVVLGVVIGVGFVLLIVPGVILVTIWAYALVLIADKGLSLGEAMSGSSALAKRPGYVMTFVTLFVGWLVVAVVAGVLGMIPVIGQIIGMVIGVYMIAYLVAMYFQATGETELLDHALYGVPLPAGAGQGAPGSVATPAAPAAASPAPPPPPTSAPAAPPAAPEAPAAPPSPGAPPSDPWAAAADPLAQPPTPGSETPEFEPPSTTPPPPGGESAPE